jgi:hypothetical protein
VLETDGSFSVIAEVANDVGYSTLRNVSGYRRREAPDERGLKTPGEPDR